MKRYIFLILIILLSLVSSSANSSDSSNYTFSKYTTVLENEIFPEIKLFLKSYKFLPPTKENSKELTDEVAKIIKKYEKQKKILFVENSDVSVLTMENEFHKVFVLEVRLILYDSESSEYKKFTSSVLFGKRFLIYIHNKKSGVEV